MSRPHKPLWPFSLNQDSSQANGLTGWWPGAPPGGLRVDDLSLYRRHGGLIGFASPFTATSGWTVGVDGGQTALAYAGSTQLARILSSATLPVTNALSVALWVKTSNVANYNYLLVKWGSTNGTDTFHLRLDATTGFVYWTLSTNGNYQSGNDLNGTTNVSDGKWHHVAGTYDGTTSAVYVDGKQQATKAVAGNLFATSQDVVMGGLSDNSAGGNWLIGSMDDPCLYNRALTQSEVWAMFDPRTRWEKRWQAARRWWGFALDLLPPPPPPPPAPPAPPPYFDIQPRSEDDGWEDDDFTEDFDPRNAATAIRAPIAADPSVDPATTRPSGSIKIDHDDRAVNVRSRRHEADVAMLLNAMVRLGIIQGSIKDPRLGYFPIDPQAWGAERPTTLAEALDALIEILGGSVDMATQAELDAHINDTIGAHAASAISFTPVGPITATDVQTAITQIEQTQQVGGPPGMPGEDGADGFFYPPPLNGLPGRDGLIVPGMAGEDGDDGFTIPGAKGDKGDPGIGIPGRDGEDADTAMAFATGVTKAEVLAIWMGGW